MSQRPNNSQQHTSKPDYDWEVHCRLLAPFAASDLVKHNGDGREYYTPREVAVNERLDLAFGPEHWSRVTTLTPRGITVTLELNYPSGAFVRRSATCLFRRVRSTDARARFDARQAANAEARAFVRAAKHLGIGRYLDRGRAYQYSKRVPLTGGV